MSFSNLAIPSGPLARRVSRRVLVANGARQIWVGGDAPVVVQSMTNTDTADVIGTAIQVKELARAGSEMVRITVNNAEAAAAVPLIREREIEAGKDDGFSNPQIHVGERIRPVLDRLARRLDGT